MLSIIPIFQFCLQNGLEKGMSSAFLNLKIYNILMLEKNLFRFCGRCALPLRKNRASILFCANCQTHFYINPRPTNAAIIENSKHEILLTKRKFAPKKGFWDLPGGFANPKETMEQAVKREIKEELGIELVRPKYFGSYWGMYYYKGITYYTLCFVYTAKLGEQKITVGDDVSAYKFFASQHLPVDKLAFKDITGAIKDYLIGKQPVL